MKVRLHEVGVVAQPGVGEALKSIDLILKLAYWINQFLQK